MHHLLPSKTFIGILSLRARTTLTNRTEEKFLTSLRLGSYLEARSEHEGQCPVENGEGHDRNSHNAQAIWFRWPLHDGNRGYHKLMKNRENTFF